MKLVHVLVAAVAISLVAAPVADAKQPRKLSEKKVRTFLKPIASEMGAQIAEDLKAQGDPTVTVVASNVGDCERQNRRRIDCDLNITFRDAEGDLTCSVRIGVKYRNKRSKKLVFAVLSDKPKCYVQ
jgi:hypothetical protein